MRKVQDLFENKGVRYFTNHGQNVIIIVAVIAVLVQACAGLALRGLYADGANAVTKLAAQQGLSVIQGPRVFSEILGQWPVIIGMWFGARSVDAVAVSYSVSSNVMPGILIILCCLAFPRNDRKLAAFPIFIYFATILSGQFSSVSESLAGTAYFWLVLTLVVFGSLSGPVKIFLVLLAPGCLYLQEETLFLGPVLIAACIMRMMQETENLSRLVLFFVALCGAAGTMICLGFTLHPIDGGERSSFLTGFIHFRWLYSKGWLSSYDGINLCVILAMCAAVCIATVIARPRMGGKVLTGFFVFSISLSCLSFFIPFFVMPLTQFDARHNATLLTLPLGILFICVKLWPRLSGVLLTGPVYGVICALGVSVTIWHVAATREWLEFRHLVVQTLENRQGIISWESILQTADNRQKRLLWTMSFPWTNPDLSIGFFPRAGMASIIAAPVNYHGWQPYVLTDPKTMPAIPGLVYTYMRP